MHAFGRLLQYVGLILLPLAIVFELSNKLDRGDFGLSEMLIMMVFGFCAFQLGRYMEGVASAKRDA